MGYSTTVILGFHLELKSKAPLREITICPEHFGKTGSYCNECGAKLNTYPVIPNSLIELVGDDDEYNIVGDKIFIKFKFPLSGKELPPIDEDYEQLFPMPTPVEFDEFQHRYKTSVKFKNMLKDFDIVTETPFFGLVYSY